MRTPFLMIRLSRHLLCLSACTVLLACSPQPALHVPSADLPPPSPADSRPVRTEAWKLDRLISCYNDADERAHAAIAGYLGWVGDQNKGPTGLETRVPGIRELPAAVVDRCSDHLHIADTEGPRMRELDGTAHAYLAALRDLSMQILPLHRYYRREGHKDDGFAHGRALHGKVMEAAQRFAHASEAFSRQLDRENERHMLAQLADMQEGGLRNAGYYRLALMFDGRRLVRILDAEHFDVDEAQRQLAAFERIADSALATGSTGASQLRDPRLVHEKAVAFLKLARTRAGQEAARQGAAWAPSRDRDHLLRAYNDLADAINRSK